MNLVEICEHLQVKLVSFSEDFGFASPLIFVKALGGFCPKVSLAYSLLNYGRYLPYVPHVIEYHVQAGEVQALDNPDYWEPYPQTEFDRAIDFMRSPPLPPRSISC